MNCFKKQVFDKCCWCIPLNAGVYCLLFMYLLPAFLVLFYSINTTFLYVFATLFYLVVKVAVTTLYMAGTWVKKSVLCIPYLLYFFMSVLISRLLCVFIMLHKLSLDDRKEKTTLHSYITLFVMLLPIDVYFFLCICSMYVRTKEREKNHDSNA